MVVVERLFVVVVGGEGVEGGVDGWRDLSLEL